MGEPHADYAIAEIAADDIGSQHTHEPHGDHTHDHGIGRVARGAQKIWDHKRRNPEEDSAAAVDEHDLTGQHCRFGRDVVHAQNERDAEDQRDVDKRHDRIGRNGQLFHIVPRAVIGARADALAHHGRQAHADGLPCKHMEIAHRIADGVGRDARRAKGGDEAEEDEPSEVEHPVLHAAGDGNAEDVAHDALFKAERADVGKMQLELFVEEQPHDHDRRHRARDERGNGDARHIEAEAEDQNGVARHVDAVHQQRDLERHAGARHRAEERRAAVVERDARNGGHNVAVIDVRRLHDVRVDVPEKAGDDQVPKQV